MVGKCYGVSNNLMEDLGRKIGNENVVSNNGMGVFSCRSIRNEWDVSNNISGIPRS